ncbi:hypothetical protein CDD83_745 [Cordyceps sp. RAO-2017]|nr:hypothetical protein CDD83_745 [Cordyceps sp. RAO-2017]
MQASQASTVGLLVGAARLLPPYCHRTVLDVGRDIGRWPTASVPSRRRFPEAAARRGIAMRLVGRLEPLLTDARPRRWAPLPPSAGWPSPLRACACSASAAPKLRPPARPVGRPAGPLSSLGRFSAMAPRAAAAAAAQSGALEPGRDARGRDE